MKKTNKIIISIILTILILINIYFFVASIIEKDYSYIIFDQKNIWQYDEKTIKKVNQKKLKKLSYEKVKIYDDTTKFGYYDNDNNILYDENYEKEIFSFNSFLVSGSLEINDYSLNLSTDVTNSDKEIIQKVLLQNGKNEKIENLSILKLIYESRTFYSVTLDSQNLSNDGNQIFSMIFEVNNDEVNLIYNKYKGAGLRLSYLSKVIDIDNDNELEIILLSDIDGSGGNECYSLYKYNKNSMEYEPVIDCEG